MSERERNWAVYSIESGGLMLEFQLGYYQPWSVNELTNTPKGNAIRSKQKKWWKEESARLAREALSMGLSAGPSNVQVAIPFRVSKTRRDPHNYVGTVVKSIVDGLVAGGLWPDDDPTWVTVIEPVCYKGSTVQILIEPRN